MTVFLKFRFRVTIKKNTTPLTKIRLRFSGTRLFRRCNRFGPNVFGGRRARRHSSIRHNRVRTTRDRCSRPLVVFRPNVSGLSSTLRTSQYLDATRSRGNDNFASSEVIRKRYARVYDDDDDVMGLVVAVFDETLDIPQLACVPNEQNYTRVSGATAG